MSEEKKIEDNTLKENQKRIIQAKNNFKKIQEKIAPFTKRKKFKEYSTAGEWRETSSLYS